MTYRYKGSQWFMAEWKNWSVIFSTLWKTVPNTQMLNFYFSEICRLACPSPHRGDLKWLSMVPTKVSWPKPWLKQLITLIHTPYWDLLTMPAFGKRIKEKRLVEKQFRSLLSLFIVAITDHRKDFFFFKQMFKQTVSLFVSLIRLNTVIFPSIFLQNIPQHTHDTITINQHCIMDKFLNYKKTHLNNKQQCQRSRSICKNVQVRCWIFCNCYWTFI